MCYITSNSTSFGHVLVEEIWMYNRDVVVEEGWKEGNMCW